jgi:hypothetical protein
MLMPNMPFFFQIIIVLLCVGFAMWLINVLPFIAPPVINHALKGGAFGERTTWDTQSNPFPVS